MGQIRLLLDFSDLSLRMRRPFTLHFLLSGSTHDERAFTVPSNLAEPHKHPLSGAGDELYWACRMKNRCSLGVHLFYFSSWQAGP